MQVGRVFDVPEAWLARDTIRRAPEGAKLVLDFHRTTELHDFALAVLIDVLSRSGREIEVVGLSGHQRSLLRMLGKPNATVAG